MISNWLSTLFTGGCTDHDYSGYTGLRPTSAGAAISEENSLTLSAVFCAITNICSHMAMLPFPVYQRTNGDDRERLRTHPVTALFNENPNPEMTAYSLRQTVQQFALLWGTGSIEIVRDAVGNPAELYPIHPRCIKPDRDEDGNLYFKVRAARDNGNTILDWAPLPARDVIRIPGITWNGISGVPVIYLLAAENLGRALAIEQYASNYFGNGANFGSIMSIRGHYKDEDHKANMEAFQKNRSGAVSSWGTLFLYGDMEFHRTAPTLKDLETTKQSQYSVQDVSRWFNIPPHMLMDLSRATFSNITEQSLGYVRWCLAPWQTNWKQECSRKTLPMGAGQFLDYVNQGILQGDPKGRSEYIERMLRWGVMSLNEARRVENMNSLGPAGDVHFVPMNYTTLDQAAAGAQGTQGSTAAAPQEATAQAALPAVGRPQMRAAMLRMATEMLHRLVRKECNGARGVCGKHPGDERPVREWADRFYDLHDQSVNEVLQAVCVSVAQLAGVEDNKQLRLSLVAWSANAAREYCATQHHELCEAHKANEVPGLLQAWQQDTVGLVAADVVDTALDMCLPLMAEISDAA